MLLEATDLSKEFEKDVILFENVSFSVAENDKIGLIGANGAGKSTLFSMITGNLTPDTGGFYRNKLLKIGHMAQLDFDNSRTCLDELMQVYSHLSAIEKQLDEVTAKLLTSSDPQLIKTQQRLMDNYEQAGGYTHKSIARSTLIGLGFTEAEFSLPVATLSGGQRTRLELSKILLSDSNLMLLDEPTNHLDIEAIQWLEEFLKNYNRAFIVISHDRYFLDAVTQRTLELEHGKLTIYDGAYTFYKTKKDRDNEILTKHYTQAKREIARVESIVEQQRRWGREKNIKTAESKLKQIKRMQDDLVEPDKQLKSIKFSFALQPGGGNDVLQVLDLSKAFGDKVLFENANMYVKKGERVFLLGGNGCGKSTLLKIIMGQDDQYGGQYKIGTSITHGYYAQNLPLPKELSVIEYIRDKHRELTETAARNALASFLFMGDDVYKWIGTLSGGERARVALLSLALSKTNFLVLDEPTNHLDIKSKEVLEQALLNYEGTIVAVSHDRYFINKLANRIYNIQELTLKHYNGDYTYFIEKREVLQQQNDTFEQPVNEYLLKKQLLAQQRKARSTAAKLESQIETTEQQIKDIELQMSECAADYQQLMELSEQLASHNQILSNLYEEWENLAID